MVAGMRGAIPNTWRPIGSNDSASSAAMCSADGLNFTSVGKADAGAQTLVTKEALVST